MKKPPPSRVLSEGGDFDVWGYNVKKVEKDTKDTVTDRDAKVDFGPCRVHGIFGH